jgi:serine/threonine-protein kinase
VVEIMMAVTSAPRPRIHAVRPDLSPDIDAWAEQALAVERDDRFSSVKGTWQALRSCFPGAA